LWYDDNMSSVLIMPPRATAGRRRASQLFTNRLIESELGPQIACVLLFGSVAHQQDEPESDIDILVFGNKLNPEQVGAIADIAWDTTLLTDEFIAPLAYNINDLLEARNFLIYDAIRHAKVLYRMDEIQIRRLEAQNIYRKAEIHLDEAKKALSQQAFHLALVGAYTAAELAAKALLYLKPGVDIPSKHGSIIRSFGKEYVTTGEAPDAWGRALNRELEVRSRVLYDTMLFIEDSTKPESVIELAQEMLAYLGERLSNEATS